LFLQKKPLLPFLSPVYCRRNKSKEQEFWKFFCALGSIFDISAESQPVVLRKVWNFLEYAREMPSGYIKQKENNLCKIHIVSDEKILPKQRTVA